MICYERAADHASYPGRLQPHSDPDRRDDDRHVCASGDELRNQPARSDLDIIGMRTNATAVRT